MVGQQSIRDEARAWRERGKQPRVILISGPTGSGKYTLAKEISSIFGFDYTDVGTSIESIRSIIASANINPKNTCYIIKHVEDMSINGANSLLKIIEEPPNNAYFIMTTVSMNILPTIRSRAVQIFMLPYYENELREFTDDKVLLDNCSTPGEILYWKDKDFNGFMHYCVDIANNITVNTGVETLRISHRFEDKQEVIPKLISLVYANLKMPKDKSLEIFKLTLSARSQLNVKSYNKLAILDSWLVDVRNVLRG